MTPSTDIRAASSTCRSGSTSASRTFQLGVLTFGHFIVDMYGGFFAPLMPALARETGIRYAALTALAGVGGIVVNGVQPLAGLVIHRMRAPYFLAIGPALAATASLIGVTHSFWVLGAIVMLSFVGTGVFHPDGLLAAHAAAGDRSHVAVPVFLSGGYLGYSVGALVATNWAAHLGLGTMYLLAVPGAVLLALYPLSGLMRVTVSGGATAQGPARAQTPHVLTLLALGSLLATTSTLLFTFITTHLEAVMGESGLVIGGQALFVIGIGSAFSSYLWGHLGARRSPFALIAIGQVACIPVYLALVSATGTVGVLALSAVLGPLTGFYPVVATMARHARGLTPGLRSGVIVGGSWLVASLPVALFGWLIERGVPVRTLLCCGVATMAAAATLAAVLYVRRRATPGRAGAPEATAV